MKNYIYKIGIVALLSLMFACSEDTMDRVNERDDSPQNAMSKTNVTELLVNTAFTVGGDFALYATVYIEHEVGIEGQLNDAEKRSNQPTATSTYNNPWSATYENIKLAKLIIRKCSTDGEEVGNDVTLGVGKLMLAYNGAVLTDLFGDIPFSEAGEALPSGLPIYRQPKVDKQEDVYKEIFKLLDEAIVLFDGTDSGSYGPMGSNDMYYGGNASLWKKAAYALKARATMRLLNTYSNKTEALNNVITYVNQSFKSAAEEFKFDHYDGSGVLNPLYAYILSRKGVAASESYVQKLTELDDPRLLQMFMYFKTEGKERKPQVVDDIKDLIYAKNGLSLAEADKYGEPIANHSSAAPTILCSYHELLFLKAEAEARLNKKAEAEASLKLAMRAAFDNLKNTVLGAFSKSKIPSLPQKFDLSNEESDSYFTNKLKPLFETDPLSVILIQKYLALAGANGESMEAYNDYRRLLGAKENYIKLMNPNNENELFPLRYIYGSGDVINNPNVGALVGDGYYVYKEPVWWAGGTR